jgi:hypothetical protein
MLSMGPCHGTDGTRRLFPAFAIFSLVYAEVENSHDHAKGEEYNNYNNTNDNPYVDSRAIGK